MRFVYKASILVNSFRFFFWSGSVFRFLRFGCLYCGLELQSILGFFFGITFAGSVVDLFGERQKLDLLSVGEPL